MADGNADAASVASSQSYAAKNTLSDSSILTSQPFPQLRNNASDGDTDTGTISSRTATKTRGHGAEANHDTIDDDDDEEPVVAKPFVRTLRTASPVEHSTGRLVPTVVNADDSLDEAEEDEIAHSGGDGSGRAGAGGGSGNGGAEGRERRTAVAAERLGHKMHKFTLYETASRYYVVGEDVTGRRFRVLKIDRTASGEGELGLTDDKIVYTQKEMTQVLDMIDQGNRGTGGIKVRCTMWGLLGFIRFTGPYYMMLITKKSTVAVIGGHVVYQIAGTELVPLTPGRGAGRATEGGSGGGGGDELGNGGGDEHGEHHHGHQQHHSVSSVDEARFLGIFNHVNLAQAFYFSYSYDITHTLQHNITREREALAQGRRWSSDEAPNSMFVWNTHLLQPARAALATPFDWCRAITHGYMDQASISIYGRTAYVAVIARRSRHFAGARFLKRGANDVGYVANDVETEQIVSDASTTSFHAPGGGLFANAQYTAYVQHRGSIPLYWTQENTGVTPKPPIELNLVDPFYSAAALHFDDLFARYGAPIYVLDLVKARESTPRESKLLAEFQRATQYLNQFLPPDRAIIHHAWDMSRANKSRDVNVIAVLEGIAETVVATTGFFRNGAGDGSGADDTPARVQNGVARTNCIDCLDRTNAAQFVIGKCALGHQLHALGILDTPCVRWETDAVNLFTHMYHDHGDTIAVQYGGSQLVNTMETYRKINQWQSHSRDMLESFKRYYNNSFLDGQRQEAYNLFLGNYIYAQGQPMLWDLPTDYHLHHADPRRRPEQQHRRDYVHWFTPAHLRRRVLPPLPPPPPPHSLHGRARPLTSLDDYWVEFYRPAFLSSFAKMFTFRIKSTMKYIPPGPARQGQYDLSPFQVRSDAAEAVLPAAATPTTPERRRHRKEVSFATPEDVAAVAAAAAHEAAHADSPTVTTARHTRGGSTVSAASAASAASADSGLRESLYDKQKPSSLEKTRRAQWTLAKMVEGSLQPTVQETDDYERYIRHLQNLRLVVPAAAGGAVDLAGTADMVTASNNAEYAAYVDGSWKTDGLGWGRGLGLGEEDDTALYGELLHVPDNPLTVTEGDAQKKRYKAYRKWLQGKSFFKQQPVDGWFKSE